MKLLYYSTAYHATHGGSIQSIEFYNTLSEFDTIENTELYPKGIPTTNYNKTFKNRLRAFLKKIALLQVFFFYRKNKMYMEGLEEFIAKFNPDVIVCQTDSNFLQIEKLKSKFPDIIISTQVNASPFDEPFKNIAFKKYFLKKQSRVYAKADYNFFVSEFLRKRIMGQFLDEERDIIVHNGTDTEKFRPLHDQINLRKRHNYPLNKFLIGYIGTLDFHKKLDILIDSIDKLNIHNISLVIIGDGPAMESLINKVTSLQLEDKVLFQGWIDHKLMNEHLNCFDLAIHHHANEYMSPLKIFEYLSSGLPVIAPDISAVREIFKNDVEVVYTKPTVSSITMNILNLYKDKARRELLANRGATMVRENFTWYNYTKNIIRAIDKSPKKESKS